MRLTLNIHSDNAAFARVAGRLPRVQALMVRRMAERYVQSIHDDIAAGMTFTPRTGQLEQSVGWRPTGETSTRVYAHAEHAPYVEHGTRPHVIRPRAGRKALRFFVGGKSLIRGEVNHPGTKAMPFFFRALPRRRVLLVAAARKAWLEEMAA